MTSALAAPGPRTLTDAREAAGMTKAALARALHVSGTLVSTWERGVRRPDRSYWPAIEVALGLPSDAVGALFSGLPSGRLDGVPLPAVGAARRRAGLTQTTVARLVGVAPTTLSMWEIAGVRVPEKVAVELGAILRTTRASLSSPPARSRTCDSRPLRRLRRAAGLSRPEASAYLEISLASLSRYEAGERRTPVVVARRMAVAYRQHVAEIFGCCGIELAGLPAGARWRLEDVAQVIAAARTARGWTKVELGRAVGRSGQAVNSWEVGRTTPDPASCRRLEAVLGLPPGKLSSAAGHPAVV